VFRFWKELGVAYMFLGPEAIDEDGLKKYRNTHTARSQFRGFGICALARRACRGHLIADPDWDRERFRIVRDWCLEQPEIVNISVNTPLSRDGELADRGASAAEPRLSAVRYPARGVADAPCHYMNSTKNW